MDVQIVVNSLDYMKMLGKLYNGLTFKAGLFIWL